jgi:ABC-type uncharacterized transport system YnjBCD permease subunit
MIACEPIELCPGLQNVAMKGWGEVRMFFAVECRLSQKQYMYAFVVTMSVGIPYGMMLIKGIHRDLR